jgi:methionyl-tRNA formyltransferase
LEFVKKYKSIQGKKQKGKSTFYLKRSQKSSELDINKSIKSQFNLLRVVDNERYPAFFNYENNQYILKIFKTKI